MEDRKRRKEDGEIQMKKKDNERGVDRKRRNEWSGISHKNTWGEEGWNTERETRKKGKGKKYG